MPSDPSRRRSPAKRGRQASRTAAPWRYVSRSAAETDNLGRLIGASLSGGEVLALYGELGTGKTTLVRGVAAGLGVPGTSVSSPTFVLIHEYRGRLMVAHADLYRLAEADVRHVGLDEYLTGKTVLAIEWAERAARELPADRLEIRLSHGQPRSIVFYPTGPRSQALLARVMKAGRSRRTR